MKKIKIASRKSILALKQTQIVIDMLKEKYPLMEFEIVKVHTKGDENLEKKLSEIGSKGLFTHEIEKMLFDKTVDIAVHSLKDMPTDFEDNLQISAYIKRHSHKDIIIFSKKYKSMEDLPNNAKIGTSSLRREIQLKKINSNFDIQNIRGNIHTRLEKMEKGNFDAIILAKAGLERLDMLKDINYQELPFIPAAGQGCICVETTKDNEEIISILKNIDDELTRKCVTQEREFLKNIGGGCHTATGSYCKMQGDEYIITAFVQAKFTEDLILKLKFLKSNEGYIFDYFSIDNEYVLIYAQSYSDKIDDLGLNLADKLKNIAL